MVLQELQIFTSQLQEQLEFYSNVLQLPVIGKSAGKFKVKIGYSVLEFIQKKETNPYHIAFHIDAGHDTEALEWLKKKVSILKNNKDELIDFPSWKAKSIYFYDAGKNVLEFISRKHLYSGKRPFSEKSIKGIAEIGLSTNSVEETFRELNEEAGLELYFGSLAVFCAAGDDHGLIILVDKNTKKWFPTGDNALPADFILKFEHQKKHFKLKFEEQNLILNQEN